MLSARNEVPVWATSQIFRALMRGMRFERMDPYGSGS